MHDSSQNPSGSAALDSIEANCAKYADVPEQCVCLNFRKVARSVTHVFDEAMHSIGLRSTQLSILATTYLAGGATLAKLAANLVMDRTTLTRNLKPLEKRGLVTIAVGNDRRSRVVTITREGKKLLSDALPLWRQAQEHFVDRLGDNAWDELRGELDRAVEIAQQFDHQPV